MPIQLNPATGITNVNWTTSGRPRFPVSGQMGFNTTLGQLETWSGTQWVSAAGGNGYGTVQSIRGIGNVSGISLSGNVTTVGNLTLSGALNLAIAPPIGTVTPNAGVFTTLSVLQRLIVNSPLVDAVGSPGAAGQVLSSTGTGVRWLTGGGGTVNLSSPPPIGNVTPNTGAFTTLAVSAGLRDSTGSTGTTGQFLTSTTSGIRWTSGGGNGGTTLPSAPNLSIQFNQRGVFGGDANLLWDGSNLLMSVGSTNAYATIKSSQLISWRDVDLTLSGGNTSSNSRISRTAPGINLLGTNSNGNGVAGGSIALNAGTALGNSSQGGSIGLTAGYGNGGGGSVYINAGWCNVVSKYAGTVWIEAGGAYGYSNIANSTALAGVLQLLGSPADQGNGGQVVISGGGSNIKGNGKFVKGGNVIINGGNTYYGGNAGNVYIVGGQAWDRNPSTPSSGNRPPGNGGSVFIDAGIGNLANVYSNGAVYIGTGANTTNVYIGNTIANVHIGGGANGQTIITDGNGNLSWGAAGPNVANLVTKIVAGNNVTISPSSGLGVVTINAAGGGNGGGAVTQIIAGSGIDVSPTTGIGAVTITNTGSGGGGGIGYGQTWQDVRVDRTWNAIYTNTTTMPIQVNISFQVITGAYPTLSVDGIEVAQGGGSLFSALGWAGELTAIVPVNSVYKVVKGLYTGGSAQLLNWVELRS